MTEKSNPYGGRWVAKLRGRIVAQGGTPEQARRAAGSRFKEIPEIIYMPADSLLVFPPLLDLIRKHLPAGEDIYLVGGAVRDAFLQRAIHDMDFSLQDGAIRLARSLANALNGDFYPLDAERDTGRVILTNADGSKMVLDFASFRGRDLAAGVNATLATDLNGRDFTVNAIAYNLRDNSLHDPLGGVVDLREKRLRACSPTAILDDPVRILRGIRIAADFGFHLLPEMRQQMKAAAASLPNISAERLRDELFRILQGTQPAACIRSLDILGAVGQVLPELPVMKGVTQRPPHVYDVWEHTLAVVGHLERILAVLSGEPDPDGGGDVFSGVMMLRIGRYRKQLLEHIASPLINDRTARGLLFLAALYHDAAKPQVKKVGEDGQARFWDHDNQGAVIACRRARALMLSNDEADRLEKIVKGHMRIHFLSNRLEAEGEAPTRRAVYRFFRDTGEAGLDICLLTLADLRGTYQQTLPQARWTACLDVVRTLLEAWYERPEQAVRPVALVDGNVLQRELALKPGPMLGKLLEDIRESQAAGEVTTREEALAAARRKLEELEGNT